jgi:hypothetical protein
MFTVAMAVPRGAKVLAFATPANHVDFLFLANEAAYLLATLIATAVGTPVMSSSGGWQQMQRREAEQGKRDGATLKVFGAHRTSLKTSC